MLVHEDLQDFVIREENYYFFARFVPSLTFSTFLVVLKLDLHEN
jgi:hypothetical protein